MRSKIVAKNVFSSIAVQLFSVICSLIIKKCLLNSFSLELIGINSLFDTFFTTLLYLDLGFSAMMAVSLFKSINEGDDEQTRKTLSLYKTVFIVYCIITFVIGLIASQYLYTLFDVNPIYQKEVRIIFMAQLVEMTIRFLLMYKLQILNYYQKKYVVDVLSLGVYFTGFLVKLYCIEVLKNFLMFSIVTILIPILLNLLIVYLTNTLFPIIKNISCANILELKKSGVVANAVKYVPRAFHGVVYYSMDSILISSMFSLSTMALISNYNMVYGTLNSLVSTLRIAVQSTIANHMYVVKSEEADFIVLQTVNMLNVLIVSIFVCGFGLLSSPFIIILFGSEYVIDNLTIMLLALMLGVNCYIRFYENIYLIDGLVLKEKWSLIISALLNLLLSIVLGKLMGVSGVYLATLISTIILWISRLKLVINSSFAKNKKSAYINLFQNISSIFINILITSGLYLILPIKSEGILGFVFSVIFIVMISCISFLLLNIRNKYFKNLLIIIKKAITQ